MDNCDIWRIIISNADSIPRVQHFEGYWLTMEINNLLWKLYDSLRSSIMEHLERKE
jgi:hypothetical protein